MAKIKKVQESEVIMTEMVLPNDTNTLNNLMGGKLMHWLDVVGAIAAQKHSNSIVVTASADSISFQHPIALGNVVTLKAQVTRSFNSSMEVYIEVWAEDIPANLKTKTHRAFFTFVAVDHNGKPTQVPQLEPSTPDEKELYDGALRRRQLRLVLSKRMDPKDAVELKSIFGLEEALGKEKS